MPSVTKPRLASLLASLLLIGATIASSISSSTATAVATGFTVHGTTGASPYGIAIDSLGNIYTANNGTNTVSKITPSGVSSTYGTVVNGPWAIAVDQNFNVFYT